MKEDMNFFNELDTVVKRGWEEVTSHIKECITNVISFEYVANLDKDIKLKYGLNDDIVFVIKIDSIRVEGETQYYYKGRKMEPICYYLRPDDYHEVSTLTMLRECIRQDTNKPDIMFLERGEILN